MEETIKDELSGSNARKLVNEELKHVRESIMAMEKDFAAIRKLVLGIDEKKVVQFLFAPEWIGLHDTYTKLMLKHQETASTAKSKIEHLVMVLFLAARHTGTELEKKSLIDKYIKDLFEFEKQGNENMTQFLHLRQKCELLDRQYQLGRILEDIYGVKHVFQNLVKKLQVMENIWNMLVADAYGLSHSLNVLKRNIDDDMIYYEIYGEATKKSYKVFADGLDAYILAVAK